MRGLTAAKAYQSASRHRSLREQEADVFLRVNALLRQAQHADDLGMSRALADNDRLWMAVMDQLRDPDNGLPPSLRGSIISVGLAVQREAAADRPDLGFLIGVNEQLAAGLMGV